MNGIDISEPWDLTMYPIQADNLDILLDLIDEYVELVESLDERH